MARAEGLWVPEINYRSKKRMSGLSGNRETTVKTLQLRGRNTKVSSLRRCGGNSFGVVSWPYNPAPVTSEGPLGRGLVGDVLHFLAGRWGVLLFPGAQRMGHFREE